MSGFFRIQVRIPMDHLTPEDDVINVWHFDSDQSFSDDADDVVGRLRTFYQAIDGVIFPGRVGSSAAVKVYDLADPEPRVPGLTDTITLSNTTDLGVVPNEVAICLSMAAAPVSGQAAGRLRGRIFLGPVASSALQIVSDRVRITSTARTAIVNAAVALATGPDPGDGRLAVYSPTTHAQLGGGAANLPDAFNDVVKVWVDNAPDIIRSRGEKADARTTGTIS